MHKTINKSERYKRQIVLPEIGETGQARINAASVLVIGAGGLGCPILLYLAAAGVGHIGIVDFDSVDETNLQRQVLFNINDIGANKAQAAAAHLHALNSDITIEVFPVALDNSNVEELFNRFDLVIDGTDNFATKFLINDAAVKTSTPFIYGSILGFDGQVSVFGVPDEPCYRCLFPEPPKGHIPNCAEAGVIGAVAGMIGTVQAMEAIKMIAPHDSFRPFAGRLLTVDMHSMQTRILTLPKNPDCPVCSKNKEDIILEHTSPMCSIIPEITPDQVQHKNDARLIDVRERDEWDVGHIDGADHIALSWLMAGNVPEIDKDQDIILYCQKGMRSLQAAQHLAGLGFSNLRNMTGGYEKWLKMN